MQTNKIILTGVCALFLGFGTGNVVAGPSGAVGQGNISVYKGGQLAYTFKGQNPVEEKALLVCDGTCKVKAPGVSLIGTGGTRLAIKKDQELFNLLVQEGRVDFILTDSISKVAFYTPDGRNTVADVMINASTNTPTRGYMQVNDNGTAEVGVLEGRLVFNSVDGPKMVDSNNRILLSLADVTAGTTLGASATGSGTTTAAAGAAAAGTAAIGTAAATGMVVAGAVVAGTVAASSSSDSTPTLLASGVQVTAITPVDTTVVVDVPDDSDDNGSDASPNR